MSNYIISVARLVCFVFGCCLPAMLIVPLHASLICNSLEITTLDDLTLLRRCTVIVGHVSITNVQLPTSDTSAPDYSTAIEEITDYLLIYRVHGLSSLQQIFPRLVIVRGQELLFERYALVVHENRDLLDLGLGALLRIQRGSVRVEANPALCFVQSVDWVRLLENSTQQHFTLKSNKLPNYCPLCARSDDHCWNLHTHQLRRNAETGVACSSECGGNGCDTSGICCSASCMSGCYASQCDICANYRSGTQCVHECDASQYKFNKRECVAADICRRYHLMPYAGECIKHCPAHHRIVYDEHGFPNCNLQCIGKFIINSANDVPGLEDCNLIRGSVIIELKQFRTNIIVELERMLRNVREITGYLKITRSPQLVSLNFLRNLDTIGGNELIDNKYALYVVDNRHLEEIWDVNQNVAVLRGHVYFHLNPRLCIEKIMELETSLKNVSKISIEDASPNSNGERVICGDNVRVLNATLEDFNATAALIKVNTMPVDDLEVLIGYMHYYKEAPERNATIYDGRHGCGHDNWLMDLSIDKNVRHIISNLRPYTQYAYFVKTLTRTDYHTQIDAYSPIQYFRTLPNKPGPVAKIHFRSVSTTEMIIHWWPPRNPNGVIQNYLISYDVALLQHQNRTLPSKNYPIRTENDADACQCNNGAAQPELSGSMPDDEDYYNKEMIIYDEALPNLIYVPRSADQPLEQHKVPAASNASANITRPKRQMTAIGMDKMVLSRRLQLPHLPRKRSADEENFITEEPEDIDAKARRLYDNYRLEMERKALRQQDNGREGFPILKAPPTCTVDNPSAQYQLENGCKPSEHYKGIALPAHQHSYTLRNLMPEQTYRISIRACVAGIDNGCGVESTFLAETVSKRMETFLMELQPHKAMKLQ